MPGLASSPVHSSSRFYRYSGMIGKGTASRPGEIVADKPGWLAATEAGLRQQKQRYRRAAEVLAERLSLAGGAKLCVSRRASAPLCQNTNAATHGLQNHVVVVRLSCAALPGVSASVGLHAHSAPRANGEPHGKRRTAGQTAGAHAHGSGQEVLQAAQPNRGIELCRPEGTPRPAPVPWSMIEGR